MLSGYFLAGCFLAQDFLGCYWSNEGFNGLSSAQPKPSTTVITI